MARVKFQIRPPLPIQGPALYEQTVSMGTSATYGDYLRGDFCCPCPEGYTLDVQAGTYSFYDITSSYELALNETCDTSSLGPATIGPTTQNLEVVAYSEEVDPWAPPLILRVQLKKRSYTVDPVQTYYHGGSGCPYDAGGLVWLGAVANAGNPFLIELPLDAGQPPVRITSGAGIGRWAVYRKWTYADGGTEINGGGVPSLIASAHTQTADYGFFGTFNFTPNVNLLGTEELGHIYVEDITT